ncbi:MAG: hypothetical protein QM752_03935 [Gammaproteobacteria bacterium]
MLDLSELYHHISQIAASDYAIPASEFSSRSTLFAATTVQLSTQTQQQISQLIQAIESVIALPAYQQKVLASAPATAQYQPAAQGLWLGYDFHLTESGVKLIEINTNAAGAGMIGLIEQALNLDTTWQQTYPATFLSEWQLQRQNQALRTVAIVDHNPTAQYFYPEFLLFKALLEKQGIQVYIADPQELRYNGQQLFLDHQPIDLIYNRLTDFWLEAPVLDALRRAYLDDAIVLTPHPRAYALHADKHNLVWLSDSQWLAEIGVSQAVRNILAAGIPPTFLIKPNQADALWHQRKGLFFKPAGRFGGKGVYKGASITHKVFQDICLQDYVAQTLVIPSQQVLSMGNYKLDIRAYVCHQTVVKLAGRLYQGQTTNFRSVGGGFAAVRSQ